MKSHIYLLAFVAIALFGCSDDPVAPVVLEGTLEQCTDQWDNDGDYLTDADDPDCASHYVGWVETTQALCTDFSDNDNDGLVDADDPNCAPYYGLSSSVVISSSSAVVNPSGDSYPFGTLPTTKSRTFADEFYASWLARFYEESPDGTMARIKWDTEKFTVSEGIAYAMLITYFQDDADRFAKLAQYYLTFRNNNKLMGWKVEGFNEIEQNGAASDADFDAVLAMIMAQIKWGWDYSGFIQEGLDEMYDELFKNDITCVGDQWCKPFNVSYISPAAFRAFALVDQNPENDWNAIINANLEFLAFTQQSTGLWPNWVELDGTIPDGDGGATATPADRFGLESLRVPWRLFWDYAWYGDDRSKVMLQKQGAFGANFGFDPKQIDREYRVTDGRGYGSGDPISIAAFCYAWASDPTLQGTTDACYSEIIGNTEKDDSYFYAILKMISLQLLSGMWQKPTGI